jgi:natural product biosynthesis luciferase-like monooxygenase protein
MTSLAGSSPAESIDAKEIMTPMRCVLIGSESLLVQCAQALEQHGHTIAAVLARRAAALDWATKCGVRVLADHAALLAAHDLRPFDYLFSITNESVLPPEVIALPTRAAINFHDGPLPAYAGLNTPVWALLNGESRHGVTWHLMTQRIDEGDILVRREFELADNETALTLNAKCFEAAIESFDELLQRIAAGRLAAQPQLGALQHCYRRKDRPAAAGTIDWRRPAREIARLVRALDYGSYGNPMSTAKALCGDRLFVVGEVQVLDQRSVAAPGSVVGSDGGVLTVASGDFDVALRRLETLHGKALSAAQAITPRGEPAAALQSLEASRVARITALTGAVSGHEEHWLRRLERQRLVELPWIDRSAADANPRYEQCDAALDDPASPVEASIASFIGYLARITDQDRFDIGYADPALASSVHGIEAWFATQVPLSAQVDFAHGFGALSESVGAELLDLRRRGTFASDLVARSPELRPAAAQRDLFVPPVALVVVERIDDIVVRGGSELTLMLTRDGRRCRYLYDANKLDRESVLDLHAQWATLRRAAIADPQRALGELPLVRDAGLARAPGDVAPVRDVCVHRLIEEQAERTPERIALICEGRSMTYAELDGRANQLARRLASLGVGPDVLVGLAVERSLEMMVGLLAIQKAGGAYLPLDPSYPKERIALMVDDAKVAVLLTQQRLERDLPGGRTSVIRLDADWPQIAAESTTRFDGGATSQHLAYVIYTSGSTGTPKGVMVEHRNVANFYAGIDEHLGGDEPGVWLAVTSLSFDISVLELCWTLARGYTVVIAGDADRSAPRGPHAEQPIDFSLFYFSSDESEGVSDKYRLLLEGAKFGDRNGFAAVWTPERHFHAFGGLYPNPSVTSAAIAAVTERIRIRAGSVVLPLHHPVRVAEEWSLVDNLSKGRVGISFASGWQPNDFVLRPENFADSKNVMLRDIETVRKLWRGEAIAFPGPLNGKPVDVRILPRPIQKELPFWVTAAGNPETFAAAGRIGAFVLTHLLGQSVDELVDKLAAYRKAWQQAGHAGAGHVTLMLHTFVGPDAANVREKVRRPLIEYLRSSANLIKQYAWSFPAFKTRTDIDLQSIGAEEMDALLEHSFERYYETSGLFGTARDCLALVDRLKSIGVGEIACLIDFGVDSESVLEHLGYLNELRALSAPAAAPSERYSLPALMQRHRVTHLQCTPSMARMLSLDPAAGSGLAALRRLMVGGEAFPPALAAELKALVAGDVMNMYGPTETTVWSSMHRLDAGHDRSVPLGRPLVNQQLAILDSRQQPVPDGVPGELVIGGSGVARGYLHRPQLTAERFVETRVGRAYRTGDRVVRRRDGTLHFLGRLDHQVKLRGFRMELGEIEAALLQARPALREAVVIAREDAPGDLRLVAYLVGEAPSAAELRERLKQRLPEYMVPAHFVTLKSMPKTPNGKLDRKALPPPDAHAVAAAAPIPFIAPSGELEQTIASVWKELLKLPQVGTRDNFFDLGGHSLLAVQAHRRLRDVLQRPLSLTDMFRFPTIDALAAYLADGDGKATAQHGQDRAADRRAALLQRRGRARPATETADTTR